jgi:2-keto-4-pentenoate hydratase
MESCEQMADLIVQARRERRPTPDFSRRYREFDLATAYRVQHLYVQKRLASDRIGGFKAGLTSKETQRQAGFYQPVAGVLFASGRLEGAPIIQSSEFGYLLAEQEFGFEIGERMDSLISDESTLRSKVRWLRPMIELGDAGFVASSDEIEILDLVAANCGSSHYIAGPPLAPRSVELNTLTLEFAQGDEVLSRWDGPTSDADHWMDALWLANTIMKSGRVIEPGQILITGGLGDYFHALPGRYSARFGALGAITFEVR